MCLSVAGIGFAAQLFASNDEEQVRIFCTFEGEGKRHRTYVTVPHTSPRYADNVQFFRFMKHDDITYETSEASKEALVYALYRELCDQISYEDRNLPGW